ncbi:MAG: chromosome segregation protein SMC [Hyphomicrobiales bacterium]|nr:chromosome segregation protein SMC [Hyphomicrobiales bacterium]
MIFSKLRLLGFKSFVEPTEFLVQNGLTGVVGPNGCGKSNLVEAMRWVMGESSYKNMRASGMDDVIFSGSGTRPSRNTAEVSLFIDNSSRTAPAAFNDDDELQVSRRIEREAGSIYRINGKEVRAKDVQLLFADASTGAHSPSMVGQGRIGELISAKPVARRALLEEAAGISGLHSRRHEAELRLRAADQNLERLEDVIGQLETQLESLKRQARQANRYRKVSASIRKTEGLLFYLRWTAAKKAEAAATSSHNESVLRVGERAEIQAKSAKEQAVIAHKLPKLREAEAAAAAALQRQTIARNQIDEDMARIARRKEELEQHSQQLQNDINREQQAGSDHTAMLAGLDAEQAELSEQSRNIQNTENDIRDSLNDASKKLGESEGEFSELTARLAEESAIKRQNTVNLKNLSDRHARLETEAAKSSEQLQSVLGQISELPGPAGYQARVLELEQQSSDAEARVNDAENYALVSTKAVQEARVPVTAARSELERIETEARTLSKIINVDGQDLFPPVIDNIRVEPGYEVALGAALGEDLDVSTESSAAVFWDLLEPGSGDPPLPSSVQALSDWVTAPPELGRRLAQVGVVEESEGAELHKFLRPGQVLVTKSGDIWRWDGYVASADAPTAAAQKLARKNRLEELDDEAVLASGKLRELEKLFDSLKTRNELAQIAERENRETWRELQKQLLEAREQLVIAERAVGQFASRRGVLEEAGLRFVGEIEDCSKAIEEARQASDDGVDLPQLEEQLNDLRLRVASDRARMAEARAAFEGMSREAEARGRRLQAIVGERESWKTRMLGAQKQIAVLIRRRDEARQELAKIEDAPAEVEGKRAVLANQIEASEAERKIAADNLARTENELAEADRVAKQALLGLSDARESSARAEERAAAARERRSDIEERIVEELKCQPHETRKLAELEDDDNLPDSGQVEHTLEKLKSERERLGAVNLRAEAEQVEIAQQHQDIISERDDLIEAIYRLRQGIASLNKEGRERLLEAFDDVNEHFKRLFTHLFGGGSAELQLVESDDPLEAGLEIMARPPGKKPQTMTLLSGGEQALTALALIFAVFLTNPAPICVLDEVDAPLDDHNVERFCNLMDEMSASTETRFIVITHNPITMARVNRLFGVTMAERGVSQLVSVDLQAAEKLVEAV